MSAFSEQEMLSLDIDWFVGIGCIYIHAASAGGMLPNVVMERKEETLETFSKIRKADNIFSDEQIEINPNLREILDIDHHLEDYQYVFNTMHEEANFRNELAPIDEYINNVYAKSFKAMARKGFISFDRTLTDEDGVYHWVARPLQPLPMLEIGIPQSDIQLNIDRHINDDAIRLVDLVNDYL